MKNIKKKIGLIMVTGVMCFSLTGCFASWENRNALKGGYFTTNKADYVILNESGGTIMDCWILKNVYVESESQSDGLRFVDQNNNGIIVVGDAKIIRINNNTDTSKYIEYHKEIDIASYEDFYKTNKK